YFPGGKEQIGAEAIARAGEKLRRTIALAADSPDLPGSINAYFAVNAQRLADSNYERGCPIAIVCLEISSVNERIRQVCEDVFNSWQVTLAQVFVDAGIAEVDAGPLATFVLASYEGALVLSRALRDVQPMLTSGEVVASVLRDHLRAGAALGR
ncbi:MAG: TetR family transcriptional regulator C-terminal domain-containing protein, partial [Acidimicrobiia bacterium]